MKIKEPKEKRKVKEIRHKKMKIIKQFRKKSGITLISVVVTIIILLILAVISISWTIGDGKIVSQTQYAKEVTEKNHTIELAKIDIYKEQSNNNGKITEEQLKKILAKYFNYDPDSQLPKDLSELILTTKDGKYNDIKASEIFSGTFSKNTNSSAVENIKEAKKLLDDNTEIISDDNVKVTIPAGFTIPEDSPTNAKEGIIITDSINESTGESNGNEFVWIPVNSDLKVVGTDKPMAKESTNEEYKGTNGKTNYEGVFYEFTETESTEMSSDYGQGTILWREPDALPHYDCEENYLGHIRNILKEEEDRYASKETFKATMQEDYNEMINSVKKYGGFFVARYEMGIENDKAISKAGIATNNQNWDDSSQQWFGLYACAKTFTNTKNSVKSSMIWGSQYDAMLNYALTGNDKDKVTAKGNGYRGSSATETGKTKNDKILNIFDLGGNYGEWTLEAYWDNHRTFRGGSFNNNYSPNIRMDCTSDSADGTLSTRLTLYIQ